MFRVQKYRLYPTEEQAEKLAEYARVVRFIYNLALEQRRDFWRQYKRATGSTLNYVSQGRELTILRIEHDWIRAVPSNIEQGALRDLDKAFAKFWAGGGYPKFRKAGVNETFEVKALDAAVRPLNRKWSQVRIPKLGWVKYRDTRAIGGEIRSTRIVCEAGKWFACVGARTEYDAPASDLPAIGIDRGVAIAIAASDGSAVTVPETLKNLDATARKLGRSLSRRKRGSTRYRNRRAELAAIKAKAARVRRDWQHKATTAICRDYGTVVIEALKTSNMTKRAHEKNVAQKRGLNRSILDIGWRSIEDMLAYKLEDRGGTLIKINPAYTSQTCSACGTIDRESRESQARFSCTSCGHTMNADHNAAINILRQGLAGVDGGGYAPVEARTIHPRLAA